MIAGRRVLAVIAARGGPKDLPRNNALDLAGRPLIARTIARTIAEADLPTGNHQ
jgi:CMP-N-acetylneuraminic acid synthetase